LDKATPENKEFLWYNREWSNDSSLNSHFCLCTRGNLEEAA
jgi:hypothetical protein